VNRRQLLCGVLAALTGSWLKPTEHEGMRLWFCERFYVDLPARYTDTIDVDWAVAKEGEHCYEAECRVRPGPGWAWEKFRMRRVE